MQSTDLQQKLIRFSAANSGHQSRRSYIGLSGIGDCDQVIYRCYQSGDPADVEERLKHRLAYELEAVLISRLTQMGLYVPAPEIVVHNMVLGHPDGLLRTDRKGVFDLLEIKTVERSEWLPTPPRLPGRVFTQIQAYMHYLKIKRAHVVYLARDTGAIRVIGASYNAKIGQNIEARLDRLRAAVSSGQPPACSCGKCRPQ